MGNTPEPFDILEWHKWKRLLNHVAIVLDDDDELMVYEAYPPTIRRLPYAEHSQKYLFRTSDRVLYRHPTLTPQQRDAMRSRLVELLGAPYSWLPNIIGAMAGAWHCLEYVCEAQLTAFGSDLYPRDLSRVGPILWRRTTINLGWTPTNTTHKKG